MDIASRQLRQITNHPLSTPSQVGRLMAAVSFYFQSWWQATNCINVVEFGARPRRITYERDYNAHGPDEQDGKLISFIHRAAIVFMQRLNRKIPTA